MLDQRAPRRALSAILLFGGVFAAWLLLKPAPPVVVLGLDGVVQVLAPLCGLALCCWRWNRSGMNPILPRASASPRQWVPLLVSAGLLAEALGQTLGLFYALVLHQASTFPSWADAAFLGAFPFFLAAILLLPARSLSSAARTRVVLDGLVVITALATCSWSVVLGPTLLQARVATFAKVVSAAYPLGDLLLLACLLLLWTQATDRAMRPTLLPFTLALSSLVVVDSIVQYQELHAGFAPGSLTDVGAALGALLAGLGTAVLRRAMASSGETAPSADAAARPNPAGVWRSLLPYSLLPLVGILTVFDWRTNADARLTVGSLLGSGILVAVVVARQIVALLDNSRLYRDLHESEGRLRTVISSTPVILFALDREGRITLAEGTGITDLGLTAEGVLGRPIFDVFPDMPQARASLQRALTGDTFTVQAEVGGLAFETRYTPLRDEAGTTVGVLGVAMDITERRNAEETLRTSEERFRALTEHATDLVTILDARGIVRYASPSYQRGLGHNPRDLCDTSAFDLVHPDDVASARDVFTRLASAPNAIATLTLRVRRLDGSWRVLELVGKNRLHDLAVQGIIMTGRDVTERVQVEDELRHQALHDALTGLPNRALLHTYLRQALAAARRDRAPLALLLLDLDHFKEVNDTFGHHYGDVLLQQVSGRLTGALRTADMVARLGGDEFAVLLPDTDQESAAHVIETLRAALDAPFSIEGHVIHVGASTGLALYPEHGEEVDTLLRCADIAMYTAKRGRENHAVYTPAQDPYTPEPLALVG